jgi:putative FmdB family regulatory protein
MPFYEYECQDCKFYTEVMQRISDPPLEKCPSCGKRALKKLVSAPVFRLKGAGWYETDFKSDSENKRNLAGADKEEAKTESKAEAGSEGKEAKPAEAKTPAAAPAPEPGRKRVAVSTGKQPVKSAARAAPPKAKRKAAVKAKPKPKAKPARKGRR